MNWIEASPLVGFLYLFVFILVRIIVLKRRGVPVSSGSDESLKFKSIIYFVFFLILLPWMLELANHAFRIQLSILPVIITNSFFESIVLKTAGNFIIVLALILFTITLRHFGDSLRFGLDEKYAGELITSGIFSFSRNPFFLSLDLYFFGTAILFPNGFFIVYAFLAILSIHFFILKEEKFLQKIYSVEYEKYAEKVGRYFSIKCN